MKRKILVVDDLHPVFRDRAVHMGFDVVEKLGLTRAELIAEIGDYQGIVVRTSFKIDSELLDAAPSLEFIARAGAGLDNIDVAYAKAKNILMINAPEGNADAVSEHAIGLLLALMNNFIRANHQIRDGIWNREANRGYELAGKTVGIVGYGSMGQRFAKKLSGFDVQVIAYDKYKRNFSDQFVREVSMEEMVKECDVLSMHIPLTAETRNLVDDEYLRHFKKPLFFINTARGEIVNTPAIVSGVKSGKILGAGLDVLETEQFPQLAKNSWFGDIKDLENIILTPHVAGWTFDSYRKISEVLAEKLAKLP